RDIHDLDHEPVGLFEEGEPEIDRDAARLFFRQPVGVGAGEGLHERSLAVIDVAGRADYDVSHARVADRESAPLSNAGAPTWPPHSPRPRATRWRRTVGSAPLSNAGAQTWPPHSPRPRTLVSALLIAGALEGAEAGGEGREVGGEDRAAVEEQAIVEEAAQHRRATRAECLVEPLGGTLGGAEGDRRGGQLHGGQGTAPHLGRRVDEPRTESPLRLRGEPGEDPARPTPHRGRRLG